MANKEENPDQSMGERNLDREPMNNAQRHPDLIPIYSMQGYPPLPTVNYDEDLRLQLQHYNELMATLEIRLRREIEDGRRLLAEIGVSEEEYRAQYGEEFQHYQYALSTFNCVLPRTAMTALYIELIRMFIALLFKESIRRACRLDRALERLQPSDTESQTDERLVISNPGALSVSPGTSQSSSSETSSSSSSSSSVVPQIPVQAMAPGVAGAVPIHEDQELRTPLMSSSYESYRVETVITRLRQFFTKLTVLDPATIEFLDRAQALVRTMESQYTSAEESQYATSADASDLTDDSRSTGYSNLEADRPELGLEPALPSGSSGSYQSCQVPSEHSLQDIANLPDDNEDADDEQQED